MKNKQDSLEKSLEEFLAKKTITPQRDFTERVMNALKNEDAVIDNLLAQQKVEVNPNFTGKVIAECKKNSVKFPKILRAFSGIAAAAALVIISASLSQQFTKSNSNTDNTSSLDEKVNLAINRDPELKALVSENPNEKLSLGELAEASEILTTINPVSFEILAYLQ